MTMKKLFIVQCPDCRARISLKADPENLPASFPCPTCKQVHAFSDYIPVDDKTVVLGPVQSRPGCLIDVHGHTYPLKEGVQTLGRASSSAQKADIPVPTPDNSPSRIHFRIDVKLCADGEYHPYVSLCQGPKAESRVAGHLLAPGDEIGLQSGDTLRGGSLELTYIEAKS